MFPSGRWRGFWEQTYWGRQPMHDLVLRFADGRIAGEGNDIIGRFTFAGEYDQTGSVMLVKQYLGRHQVLYRGSYDGEGTIFGECHRAGGWRSGSRCRPGQSGPHARNLARRPAAA
jgi:hypothetical protein